MLVSIILFLFVFTLIAIAHEGGHLIVAKKCGMFVKEFGIGFGPKLFSVNYHNTTYSLNLIPLLAYVSIAGMDDFSITDDPTIPNKMKYFSASPLSRFLMAFSGPLSNILLACIVLFIVFSLFGVPKGASTVIGQVQPNSPAENAGIKAGDQIVSIDGHKYIKIEDAIEYIHNSNGKALRLSLLRSSGDKIVPLSISATPKYNAKLKKSFLGFSPSPIYVKVNILESMYYSIEQTVLMVILMFTIIYSLITGAVSFSDLAGPIGIAQITGKYASTGLLSFLHFFAFINVNIGVLNLLPLPALDGGHIMFALWEGLTRRPVKPEVQKKIHQWGLIALLLLMLIVSINDIFRLFRPQ